jgi:hypothetical protein
VSAPLRGAELRIVTSGQSWVKVFFMSHLEGELWFTSAIARYWGKDRKFGFVLSINA